MDELKVKKCFKCNKTKELSDFYKHKEMADVTVLIHSQSGP